MATLRGRTLASAVLSGACRPLVALSLLLWVVAAYRGVPPRHSGDQGVWLDSAYGADLVRLWLGVRPPLVPALHRLLAYQEQLVVWLQAGLGCLASAFFAQRLAAWSRSHRLGSLAFAGLSLWLLLDVNDWSFTIRSEAVSHATLFCLFGCLLGWGRAWLNAHRRATWFWTAAGWASALACTATRDTMAYLVLWLAVAIPLTCAASLRRLVLPRALPLAALVGGLALIGVTSHRATEASGRYLRPLDHIIVGRVLRTPHRVAYFRDHHALPVTDALLARRPKSSHTKPSPFEGEELASYRAWLRDRGPTAYRTYLLDHPRESWTRVQDAFAGLLNHDFRSEYLARPRAGLDDARRLVQTPWRALADVTWLAVFGLCGLALLGRRSLGRWLGGLGLCSQVAGALLAFVCVHGDAMEVTRHGAVVGVLLRDITLPLTVAAGLSSLSASRLFERFTLRVRAIPRASPAKAAAQLRARSSRFGWLALVLLALGAHRLPWLTRSGSPPPLPSVVAPAASGDPAALFDGDVSQPRFCLEPKASLELLYPRKLDELKLLRATGSVGAISVRGYAHDQTEQFRAGRPGQRGWPNPDVLQLDQLRHARRIVVRADENRQCLTEIRAH